MADERLLKKEYLRKLGKDLNSFRKFVSKFCIIGNLSEKDYRDNMKILKKAIKQLKEGKMTEDVFDMESVRACIENGSIPSMYVRDGDDDDE